MLYVTLVFLLWLAATASFGMVGWRIYKDKNIIPSHLLKKEVEVDREGNTVELSGKYFVPLVAKIIRWATSIVAAVWVVTTLWLTFKVVGLETLDQYPSITILLFVLIVWTVSAQNLNDFRVPADHVAIITWLGNRWEWYLTEGEHVWLPKLFGFAVSTTPLIGAKNQVGYAVGEEQGFVFIGKRVVNIWNDVEPGKRSLFIENETRLGSRITNTFQITFVTIRPLWWARLTDPIMQIANRARSGLRESVSFLVDKDNVRMPGALVAIATGHAVVTAVTNKAFSSYPEGTVVKNYAGDPIYDIVKMEDVDTDETFKKKIEEAKKNIRDRIKDEIHHEFTSGFNDPNNIQLTIKQLKNDVSKTILGSGGYLTTAIVGDVHLSEPVSNAAQEAASVGDIRRTTIGKAQAQKEARKILALEEGEKDDQLARIGALIQTGSDKVRIVHVTGDAGDFSKAAAVIQNGDQK